MKRTYDDAMFIDTFEHEYTWLNGFLRTVRNFASRTSVIDPVTGRSWTYFELNRQSNSLSHALIDSGIGQGDVVMTILQNTPEFCFAYIAARKAGAIFLPANFNNASGELSRLVKHNNPKVIIYSAACSDVVLKMQNELSSSDSSSEKPSDCEGVMRDYKMPVFVMADNLKNIPVPAGHIPYEDFVKNRSAENPVLSFRPHIYDEAVRLCTSGTMSLPKAVPVNDINEVLSAHDVIMQYPLCCHDVTLNMTPWFHRGGYQCGGPCPAFYTGACVVVMRNFQPKIVLDFVKKYNITYLAGTPANLELLSRAQELGKFDISNLSGIITMGSPLSKDDCIRYMNVLTKNIFNGYGTTESFWNSFLRPYNLPQYAGSAGKSCLDDDVRVIRMQNDADCGECCKVEPDELVPRDDVSEGEIIIRAPGKTTYSYYKNDDAQKEKFYKGWMYTGDIGTWNEDFVVTIKGRRDNMIVVSGENVYPEQIETAILTCPKVQDCIVTSVPDSMRGNSVVAYVVPADESLTVDELREFCQQDSTLSKFKRPRYFAFVHSIPRNATGKKLHVQMRQRAEQDLKNGLFER